MTSEAGKTTSKGHYYNYFYYYCAGSCIVALLAILGGYLYWVEPEPPKTTPIFKTPESHKIRVQICDVHRSMAEGHTEVVTAYEYLGLPRLHPDITKKDRVKESSELEKFRQAVVKAQQVRADPGQGLDEYERGLLARVTAILLEDKTRQQYDEIFIPLLAPTSPQRRMEDLEKYCGKIWARHDI